jgi:ribulose-5-phosphate 4-epimerase/fuculose-1-phosphate aldolase
MSVTEPVEAQAEYTVEDARVDLAAAHRLAVRDGLHEATWNHLSVVVPGHPDEILVTPTLQHWSTIKASDLARVGPGEEERWREAYPFGLYIAYRIHYPVHIRRRDAVCVLHTHSPYVTAMSCVPSARLEPIQQGAVDLIDRIAYGSDYDLDDREAGQGEKIAEVLGDSATIAVLHHHGIVVTGSSVGVAYTSLYMFERACKIQYLTRQFGEAALVPEQHHEPFDSGYMDQNFEALKQLLDQEEPDYRL